MPRYDLDLEIETLPELAPQTAAAVGAALPTAGLVTSESAYGSVLCLRLPTYPRPLHPENATVFPIPGDVFVFEREHGVELVVFYERAGSVPAGAPFDACGPKAGNRVGSVTNDLSPTVREAAKRVWREGAAWGVAGLAGAPAIAAVPDDQAAAQAASEAVLSTPEATFRAPVSGSQIALEAGLCNLMRLYSA